MWAQRLVPADQSVALALGPTARTAARSGRGPTAQRGAPRHGSREPRGADETLVSTTETEYCAPSPTEFSAPGDVSEVRMLSSGQQAHFETFGFLVRQRLFSAAEMAEIGSSFDNVLAADRNGLEFPGDKRQAVLGVVEKSPALTKLVEDDRIYEAVEQLLGRGFVWIGSDGNLYVGDTGWHPDGSVDYPRIKVVFYLDPVTRDSGCLRVVPGSHRPQLHDDLVARPPAREADGSPYGVSGSELPCFPLESEPGDVVFFNQRLWHASFGGETGRRMFTLNFAARPVAESHIDYLTKTYEANLRNIREMGFTDTDRVYEESFLQSDRPRIRGMVGALVDLGFR